MLNPRIENNMFLEPKKLENNVRGLLFFKCAAAGSRHGLEKESCPLVFGDL
jgi:hypothetical protein